MKTATASRVTTIPVALSGFGNDLTTLAINAEPPPRLAHFGPDAAGAQSGPRLIAPLALMAALLAGGSPATGQPALPAGADTAFETAARAAFAASGAPGLSIAVAAREGPPRVWVLGVRRLGRQAPVEAGDPFHLASITKPLTATLIATLVESGAMTW